MTYHVKEEADFIPGQYKITSIDVVYEGGSHYTTTDGTISGKLAEDIRKQKVSAIHIELGR